MTVSSSAGVVIIGSGLAGYTVAREFRKLDAQTPLTLVTQDDGGFYSKPMLSNALAQGKTAQQLLNTPGEKMAAQLGASLLTGTSATRIDTQARAVETSAGPLAYTSLVLALGAAPIRLPLAGDSAGDVLSINHIADYAVFRDVLAGKNRVMIIGGGLIGCEFANDLVATGHAVHVVDPAPLPMATFTPAPIGEALLRALAGKGVEWHLGRTVAVVSRKPGLGYAVTLDDGTKVAADVVVSAVGLRPSTALAAEAGLVVERGIVVDEMLQTSAPDVYAIGDCAQYGRQVMPFVLPIMTAARTLAATIAGAPGPVAFPPMPVIVKTTVLPIVVCVPPPDVAGQWGRRAPLDDDNHCLCFEDEAGRVHGFALSGTRAAERAALLKAMAG